MYHYRRELLAPVQNRPGRLEGNTYLDNVVRSARLDGQGILVKPFVGTRGLALGPGMIHVEEVRNAVLHEGCEPGALHGSGTQATTQLHIEVDWVVAMTHGAHQQTSELASGVEEGLALGNGNLVAKRPGEFLKSADQTLVGALRALLGEGGL